MCCTDEFTDDSVLYLCYIDEFIDGFVLYLCYVGATIEWCRDTLEASKWNVTSILVPKVICWSWNDALNAFFTHARIDGTSSLIW